ncbi:hypothetical protein [Bradyrhizobium sp. UFLA05-112]
MTLRAIAAQLARSNPHRAIVGGTGRADVQSFGGARLGRLAQVQPLTQPIVRLQLDRMNDDGNRLFGITTLVARMPKPSCQVTLQRSSCVVDFR